MGTLAHLTGNQSLILDKMSQLVIRESSGSSETSLDQELDNIVYQKAHIEAISNMTRSKNQVD